MPRWSLALCRAIQVTQSPPVRKNDRSEVHLKLGAPLHLTRPLDMINVPLYIHPCRQYDGAIFDHREIRYEIRRIPRHRGTRTDFALKRKQNFSSGGNSEGLRSAFCSRACRTWPAEGEVEGVCAERTESRQPSEGKKKPRIETPNTSTSTSWAEHMTTNGPW